MKKPPLIHVNEHSARRLRAGYPWVFRSEVLNMEAARGFGAGEIVTFARKGGDFIGRGFFNPAPQLVGRVMTLKEEEIGAAFIRHRIEQALKYRDKLYGAPYYRLVHAESDGMPGLILDRFGGVIVAQVNTAGMEKLWPHIESALKDLAKPETIVLRNDTSARALEGLAQEVTAAAGALPKELVVIEQGGVKFHVDVAGGQKTGWFYDQRDNRAWVAQLAKGGTMIDVFCHTGGFGISAAEGAKAVTFVDSSAPALAMVKKNAALNGVEKKCETIEGAAFDVLEKLAGEGKTYDVVCVDPPAFVKSRKDMGPGLKGYQKLARLAEKIAAPGGFLFFASCSSHVGAQELAEAVADGFARAGRSFQLIRTSGAGADHPIHPRLPETGYLKGLTYRFPA